MFHFRKKILNWNERKNFLQTPSWKAQIEIIPAEGQKRQHMDRFQKQTIIKVQKVKKPFRNVHIKLRPFINNKYRSAATEECNNSIT